MDNTQAFLGRADDYAVGRPAYADAFIDYLYSKQGFCNKSVIADVGSGTGKFAKQLLDKGSLIFGVEPNEDMRDKAVKELVSYKNFKSINGTADETTLADNSVDFVTTAQAFHWFDVAMFQKECRRILKPNGKVLLIWNMRDMSAEVNKACLDIYSKYCPRFKGFGGGIQKDDKRIKHFFDNKYEYVEFDNPLLYDKDKFISRSLSGSYSLKSGDENYQQYIDALSGLFDTYSTEGILEMSNQTIAYIGEVRGII